MAKKKAKRYTTEEKQEILNFIETEGRGGLTKAVKKFKVTAASIANWKRKVGGHTSGAQVATGGSKELRALQELASVLAELEAAKKKVADLEKRYSALRSKI